MELRSIVIDAISITQALDVWVARVPVRHGRFIVANTRSLLANDGTLDQTELPTRGLFMTFFV